VVMLAEPVDILHVASLRKNLALYLEYKLAVEHHIVFVFYQAKVGLMIVTVAK
jgi:hypothetical protein